RHFEDEPVDRPPHQTQNGLMAGPDHSPIIVQEWSAAQCIPEPDSSFTSSPITAFASPNSIHVRSEKYSSLSMPANPGFLLRLIANTARALSAAMIGIP